MALAASAGGSYGNNAFAWTLEYDDSTRDVTLTVTGEAASADLIVVLANGNELSFDLLPYAGRGPTVIAERVNPRRISTGGLDGLTFQLRYRPLVM